MGRLAPKAGDDCLSCSDFWDKQGKPRKKLVRIGSTQNAKFMVVVCPYCDGERAITLPKPDANS
jgi:hypothetical protein